MNKIPQRIISRGKKALDIVLAAKQSAILECVQKFPGLPGPVIAARLGYSYRATAWNLRELADKGLIVRNGKCSGSTWSSCKSSEA